MAMISGVETGISGRIEYDEQEVVDASGEVRCCFRPLDGRNVIQHAAARRNAAAWTLLGDSAVRT